MKKLNTASGRLAAWREAGAMRPGEALEIHRQKSQGKGLNSASGLREAWRNAGQQTGAGSNPAPSPAAAKLSPERREKLEKLREAFPEVAEMIERSLTNDDEPID